MHVYLQKNHVGQKGPPPFPPYPEGSIMVSRDVMEEEAIFRLPRLIFLDHGKAPWLYQINTISIFFDSGCILLLSI